MSMQMNDSSDHRHFTPFLLRRGTVGYRVYNANSFRGEWRVVCSTMEYKASYKVYRAENVRVDWLLSKPRYRVWNVNHKRRTLSHRGRRSYANRHLPTMEICVGV